MATSPFFPFYLIPSVTGGVTNVLNPAGVKALLPNDQTPSQDVTVIYKGQCLSLQQGRPLPVDAELDAALNAANAPVA